MSEAQAHAVVDAITGTLSDLGLDVEDRARAAADRAADVADRLDGHRERDTDPMRRADPIRRGTDEPMSDPDRRRLAALAHNVLLEERLLAIEKQHRPAVLALVGEAMADLGVDVGDPRVAEVLAVRLGESGVAS